MIDRGALVLAPFVGGAYRGVYRTPLDGLAYTGRKGKELARRYAAHIVEGDGVLEDLDDAISLREEAKRMGFHDLDVVVFVVPQTPWNPKGLSVLEEPPADDLEALGWDVFEPIEPWNSPLATEDPTWPVNAFGLLEDRGAAETLAAKLNEESPGDEPYAAARVWRVKTP
jgi:hypothetical protein